MGMGARRVLVLDPRTAGVSGDMIVAALLDLGAEANRVVEAMRTPQECVSGCRRLDIAVSDVTRAGMRGKRLDLTIEEDSSHTHAPALLEAASRCLDRLSLSAPARELALRSLDLLVSAEATVHGEAVDTTVLHETASADTLADVIGAAAALDDLGLIEDTDFYATPIALGGGSLHFSHGTSTAPAPASMEIIRKHELLVVGGPVEAELATPTGVAILAALNPESVPFYPPMRPERVGYGAGSRDFEAVPNLLRVVMGASSSRTLATDRICVLETNIDDASGELIAYAMERVLEEGARDVSVAPITGKKGRPAHLLKVIADTSAVDRLSRILMEETGTLGVRFYECERRILPRSSIPVDVPVGDVSGVINIKVARDAGGRITRMKPEHEDVRSLAQRTGRPVREIERLAQGIAEHTIGEGRKDAVDDD